MFNKEITKITIDKSTGYKYFLDKEHPLATGNAFRVLLHRHIISIHLGRWISTSEIVHHIDHNKLNNDVTNLMLLSNAEHSKIHAEERGLSICLSVPCKNCGNVFLQNYSEQEFCKRECKDKDGILDKSITKEVLDALIPNMSWVALGKMFGYSDSGIKKRAKTLGCIIPNRRPNYKLK